MDKKLLTDSIGDTFLALHLQKIRKYRHRSKKAKFETIVLIMMFYIIKWWLKRLVAYLLYDFLGPARTTLQKSKVKFNFCSYVRKSKQTEFKHLNDRRAEMGPFTRIITQPVSFIFARAGVCRSTNHVTPFSCCVATSSKKES